MARLASLSLAVLFLLASGPVAARSLEEVLVHVYETNPNLNAQRQAVRKTDEEVPKALSNWRPKINGEYARTNARLDQEFGPGSGRRFTANPDALSIKLVRPRRTLTSRERV